MSFRSFFDDGIRRHDRFCSLPPLTNTARIDLEVISVQLSSLEAVPVIWSSPSGNSFPSVSIRHDCPKGKDRSTTIHRFICERKMSSALSERCIARFVRRVVLLSPVRTGSDVS